MKNTVKKAVAFLMALVMILSLAACGSEKPAETASTAAPDQTVSFKKTKIGVALYHDSGYYTENVKTYLSALGKAMNVEFIYTVLTQTDEAINLTKVQELIAAGSEGIILTLDMGTPTILSECAAANVYVAGFLCDFNTSYNLSYDEVFKNPTFLGTAADGPCGDDLRAGYDFFDSLMEYNERHPDAPLQHVSMVTFPAWAFPVQQVFVQQFTEKIDAYNETAEKPITLDPLDEAVDVLPFIPLDSTYFAKHDGIDAIFCFADGFTFVYPTMVASGINGAIKLFCAGYGEGSDQNFGSKGNGTFQQEVVSAIEAVIYPVVLLVNKINGVSFPEQVANMTAVANPSATYADLVAIMDQMTMDNIQK